MPLHKTVIAWETIRPANFPAPSCATSQRLMRHVWIGHHHITMQPDSLARIARPIAIKGEDFDIERAGLVELKQLGPLILRRRLVGNPRVPGAMNAPVTRGA
jgi:hypothetical protein